MLWQIPACAGKVARAGSWRRQQAQAAGAGSGTGAGAGARAAAAEDAPADADATATSHAVADAGAHAGAHAGADAGAHRFRLLQQKTAEHCGDDAELIGTSVKAHVTLLCWLPRRLRRPQGRGGREDARVSAHGRECALRLFGAQAIPNKLAKHPSDKLE